MTDLGLVGNGPNGTLGDFDTERVDATIEVLRPIMRRPGDRGGRGPHGRDLVTNEFIDESIGL